MCGCGVAGRARCQLLLGLAQVAVVGQGVGGGCRRSLFRAAGCRPRKAPLCAAAEHRRSRMRASLPTALWATETASRTMSPPSLPASASRSHRPAALAWNRAGRRGPGLLRRAVLLVDVLGDWLRQSKLLFYQRAVTKVPRRNSSGGVSSSRLEQLGKCKERIGGRQLNETFRS